MPKKKRKRAHSVISVINIVGNRRITYIYIYIYKWEREGEVGRKEVVFVMMMISVYM